MTFISSYNLRNKESKRALMLEIKVIKIWPHEGGFFFCGGVSIDSIFQHQSKSENSLHQKKSHIAQGQENFSNA